jgi:hypothetical protein
VEHIPGNWKACFGTSTWSKAPFIDIWPVWSSRFGGEINLTPAISLSFWSFHKCSLCSPEGCRTQLAGEFADFFREPPHIGFNSRSRRKSWARPWSRARPRCRSRCWGRAHAGQRRSCWSWSRTRRRRRSRYSTWNNEGIDFVVGGIINATASNNPCVPLTCSQHHLVGSATTVDHCAGIAIIGV